MSLVFYACFLCPLLVAVNFTLAVKRNKLGWYSIHIHGTLYGAYFEFGWGNEVSENISGSSGSTYGERDLFPYDVSQGTAGTLSRV